MDQNSLKNIGKRRKPLRVQQSLVEDGIVRSFGLLDRGRPEFNDLDPEERLDKVQPDR